MTVEELKNKIINMELGLDDLSVEDVLKLLDEFIIIPDVVKFLGVSFKEFNSYRRKMKLNDFFFEDSLRDYIVFFSYVLDNYDVSKQDFFNIVYPILFDVNHENTKKRILGLEEKWLSVDWIHMDPDLEIKNKGIDVEYRLNRNKEYFMRLDYTFVRNLNKEIQNISNIPIKVREYIPRERKRGEAKATITKVYERNSVISNKALERANYLCEYDNLHSTFIKKKDGLRYMEPHHLIPLEYQEYFKYSLDVEANIISLCSGCHNEIHYGVNNKLMIRKFYMMRIDDLRKCGIDVTLQDLYKMYNGTFIGEKVIVNN